MMVGLAKMRVRKTPANQAHVTNWREHPALLAADAAEAALRGFAEIETTVRGSIRSLLQPYLCWWVARPAMEEFSPNVRLRIVGFEPGNEGSHLVCRDIIGLWDRHSFVDGDDTPGRKPSSHPRTPSRGIKIRLPRHRLGSP
jgi:propanediol dehydratase large subunit